MYDLCEHTVEQLGGVLGISGTTSYRALAPQVAKSGSGQGVQA